ncbi:MAG: hypothetical protein HQL28_03380, partial [Candidatus Omnitrophica bacterium]|nr:hypothetical protein [Candidatus Omnitrophota bacterium]
MSDTKKSLAILYIAHFLFEKDTPFELMPSLVSELAGNTLANIGIEHVTTWEELKKAEAAGQPRAAVPDKMPKNGVIAILGDKKMADGKTQKVIITVGKVGEVEAHQVPGVMYQMGGYYVGEVEASAGRRTLDVGRGALDVKVTEKMGQTPLLRDILEINDAELLSLTPYELNRAHLARLVRMFDIIWTLNTEKDNAAEAARYREIFHKFIIVHGIGSMYGSPEMAALDKPVDKSYEVLEKNNIKTTVEIDVFLRDSAFRNKKLTFDRIDSLGVDAKTKMWLKKMYVTFVSVDSIEMGADYLRKVTVRRMKGEASRALETPMQAFAFIKNAFLKEGTDISNEAFLSQAAQGALSGVMGRAYAEIEKVANEAAVSVDLPKEQGANEPQPTTNQVPNTKNQVPDAHPFRAITGLRWGLNTGAISIAALAEAAHIYLTQTNSIGIVLGLSALGLYLAWASARYLNMGFKTYFAMRKHAWPTTTALQRAIANSDGYKDFAFPLLAQMAPKTAELVILHEKYKFHFVGMLAVLPLISGYLKRPSVATGLIIGGLGILGFGVSQSASAGVASAGGGAAVANAVGAQLIMNNNMRLMEAWKHRPPTEADMRMAMGITLAVGIVSVALLCVLAWDYIRDTEGLRRFTESVKRKIRSFKKIAASASAEKGAAQGDQRATSNEQRATSHERRATTDTHPFRAVSGLEWGVSTALLAAVFGCAAGFSLISHVRCAVPGALFLAVLTYYFLWSATRYIDMGINAYLAMKMVRTPEKEAWRAEIARSDGFRHEAFKNLSQYFAKTATLVDQHEGFASHFWGMVFTAPGFAALFNYRAYGAKKLAIVYARCEKAVTEDDFVTVLEDIDDNLTNFFFLGKQAAAIETRAKVSLANILLQKLGSADKAEIDHIIVLAAKFELGKVTAPSAEKLALKNYKGDYVRNHVIRVVDIAGILAACPEIPNDVFANMGGRVAFTEKLRAVVAFHDFAAPDVPWDNVVFGEAEKGLKSKMGILSQYGITGLPAWNGPRWDIKEYDKFVRAFDENERAFTQTEKECALDMFQGPAALARIDKMEMGTLLSRAERAAIQYHHGIQEINKYLAGPECLDWSAEEKDEARLLTSFLVASDTIENGMNLFRKIYWRDKYQVETCEDTTGWLNKSNIPADYLAPI